MTTAADQRRILVVDDDRVFRLSTAALLRADGHDVHTAAGGQEAVETLRASRFDLVLLDVKMPGTDGIGVVEALRLWGDSIPVLMISGVGTVDDAVRALHVGADDFLTKPVEPDLLSERVGELLERRPSAARLDPAGQEGMVGRAPAMVELRNALRQVAPTDTTVLITGETGTGKELTAAAVHKLSARRAGPFLAVDCGALADGLLESELFGHVKGAFTGAVRDKAGLFEAAAGGTIFLDEIGGVSFALQQRLLRVLQEREVTRVGAVRPTKVDVRVVAASNRDLRREVQAGRFREDLFYRLNVFPLTLPPLRERARDIPLLVEHALIRLGRRTTSSTCCSPFAMRLMRAYPWPGNVRELFAVVESATIRAGDRRIEAQHLPPELRVAVDPHADHQRYHAGPGDAHGEREAIAAALAQTGGGLAQAASLLGMGRTTLWRKLKAYGIETREQHGAGDE
ncbi:MAG: Response regulator of zinc sigma-54-dependent two-component system [uncultured Gemmatimonadaceae bacterium]|uniref:Response regulator of zinc sigma-54-dependent two-component system n=1 Tax=uncultured Gemmatimonadaceae bacterium TaxID=246130 RepID=A0A6J4LRN9_9BACT|nr:MAG: Response regulator of zinc sigma-54-dependent two-component system [uncultured Gemmatimonadaceae bacterium]